MCVASAAVRGISARETHTHTHRERGADPSSDQSKTRAVFLFLSVQHTVVHDANATQGATTVVSVTVIFKEKKLIVEA